VVNNRWVKLALLTLIGPKVRGTGLDWEVAIALDLVAAIGPLLGIDSERYLDPYYLATQFSGRLMFLSKKQKARAIRPRHGFGRRLALQILALD